VIGEEVRYRFSPNAWTGSSQGPPLVAGVFGWSPPGVRRAGAAGLHAWDRSATREDALRYLEVLIGSFSDPARPAILRISAVTPGNDNRPCAGWGRDLSSLPREGGETYRAMWACNVRHREKIDAVYIVSWNDFTEGHPIEPTLEDGDRELRTTAEFAAQFKGVSPDAAGLALPGRLFSLRKANAVLHQAGLAEPAGSRLLAEAAAALARREWLPARMILDRVEGMLAPLERSLVIRNVAVRLPSPSLRCEPPSPNGRDWDVARGLTITLEEGLSRELRNHHFGGVLAFEYEDASSGSIVVRTDQSATGERKAFDMICHLRLEAAGEWRTARVEISPANCRFVAREGLPGVFHFSGAGRIRNIEFQFRLLAPPAVSRPNSRAGSP
jgi:hypothetical protein